MPLNDAAPPATEVFDEMAGSGGSNNATTEFMEDPKKEGLRKAAIEERKARASETKSMSLLLAEENKIMSMNRNDMDDLTKTWHDMARREILKRRMVALTGPCSSSGDVFSAPYGANVDDFGAEVGTSDGGGFGGADELQYELHGAE
ncbi:ALA-interacting subunit 1 [Hordeum vulgare]|nr:ALA-interacting subunit 1 [Hordeum vulgare]